MQEYFPSTGNSTQCTDSMHTQQLPTHKGLTKAVMERIKVFLLTSPKYLLLKVKEAIKFDESFVAQDGRRSNLVI